MTEPKKTEREEIIALQKKMQADQAAVAKELVELISGEQTAAFIKSLEALRARTIPGQQLDQQITQTIAVIANMGQVGAQLFQHLSQQTA